MAAVFLWQRCGAGAHEAFIDDLQQRSFRYFWEQADPQTGLVPDRARMDGSPLPPSHLNVASIAATGFGLTGLCIAAERKWIDREQALERVRNTLRFFAARAFHQRGWFYHWLDAKTGERRWKSEVSSIDTALLLGGVLTVAAIFSRRSPKSSASPDRIYERIDFRWMLNGHPLLLSHGWKPETGFLHPRWDTYSEDAILYLLAIGSPHIRSRRRPGTRCGAIATATKATPISRPSACLCSCTSTRMHGSTFATDAKQRRPDRLL